MTTYFLDTSAFLRRYLNEKGSDVVDSIFEKPCSRYISAVGLIETYSNIQRLYSVDKLLTLEQHRLLCSSISDVESGRVSVTGASPAHIDAAVRILIRQYVTTVDALQLATVQLLGPSAILVSSDEKMNKLARELGISTLDPNTEQA